MIDQIGREVRQQIVETGGILAAIFAIALFVALTASLAVYAKNFR